MKKRNANRNSRRVDGWAKKKRVQRNKPARASLKHKSPNGATGFAPNSSAPTKQLGDLRKLGVSNVEWVVGVQQRQADLRERLKPNAFLRHLLPSLGSCRGDKCGRDRCVEVCAFAEWRRRLHLIPKAYRLFKKTAGPVCEVRLVRGIWARPTGGLWDVSIAAAKKLNRRGLDSLYIPRLIAVGTFKVGFVEYPEPHWVCEIHQIVAGAEKGELEKVFLNWGKEKHDSVVAVTEVENLGEAVSRALRGYLQDWQHPRAPGINVATPTKAHRQEFYNWLAKLPLDERMVRYGCDRYLNALKKKPRVMQPKVRKRRPYPDWLSKHMFGNREQPLRGFYKPHR